MKGYTKENILPLKAAYVASPVNTTLTQFFRDNKILSENGKFEGNLGKLTKGWLEAKRAKIRAEMGQVDGIVNKALSDAVKIEMKRLKEMKQATIALVNNNIQIMSQHYHHAKIPKPIPVSDLKYTLDIIKLELGEPTKNTTLSIDNNDNDITRDFVNSILSKPRKAGSKVNKKRTKRNTKPKPTNTKVSGN